MKLNPGQLEVFCSVAECGSIRAAARHLELTQPAVTYVVRELERQAGMALLLRQTQGVILTEAGEALYRRALRMLEDWRQAQNELAQMREGAQGDLRLAFSSGAAARILAPALASFRMARPRVRLDVHELSLSEPQDLWRVGLYDLAVISELDEPVEDAWERRELFRAPLHIVARQGHPMAQSGTLQPLRDCLWIVPSYGQRVLSNPLLSLEGCLPRQLMQVQSIYIALALLRTTDAVALMSSVVLEDPQTSSALVALPLTEALPFLRVSLVCKSMEALTPAAREFARGLIDAAQVPGILRTSPRLDQ
jgi:DNA-binding transcriptional LysR family regulator